MTCYTFYFSILFCLFLSVNITIFIKENLLVNEIIDFIFIFKWRFMCEVEINKIHEMFVSL